MLNSFSGQLTYLLWRVYSLAHFTQLTQFTNFSHFTGLAAAARRRGGGWRPRPPRFLFLGGGARGGAKVPKVSAKHNNVDCCV
ncbi:hypothetical protein B566_EDAN009025 [Ephemera danica]|nr:hypothetical protein B566_EDAN009025 [Ephemera danica]